MSADSFQSEPKRDWPRLELAGGKGGRPPTQPNEPKVILAKKLYRDKTVSLDDICARLKMSKSTLYRYVAMIPGDDLDRSSRSG